MKNQWEVTKYGDGMIRDKAWLKNEIEIMRNKTSENYPHEQMVDREEVLNLIDQLDEPKVLSQELPVIPQFVAEELESAKSDSTLMRVLELANTRNEWVKWEKEYDWIEENHELFARAWLDGYTVEAE